VYRSVSLNCAVQTKEVKIKDTYEFMIMCSDGTSTVGVRSCSDVCMMLLLLLRRSLGRLFKPRSGQLCAACSAEP
jgi:hypothetical protein